jgi:ABC-type transporter Mla maintaining outer membrane lipid asymmetry permease subunit MlaE
MEGAAARVDMAEARPEDMAVVLAGVATAGVEGSEDTAEAGMVHPPHRTAMAVASWTAAVAMPVVPIQVAADMAHMEGMAVNTGSALVHPRVEASDLRLPARLWAMAAPLWAGDLSSQAEAAARPCIRESASELGAWR